MSFLAHLWNGTLLASILFIVLAIFGLMVARYVNSLPAVEKEPEQIDVPELELGEPREVEPKDPYDLDCWHKVAPNDYEIVLHNKTVWRGFSHCWTSPSGADVPYNVKGKLNSIYYQLQMGMYLDRAMSVPRRELEDLSEAVGNWKKTSADGDYEIELKDGTVWVGDGTYWYEKTTERDPPKAINRLLTIIRQRAEMV